MENLINRQAIWNNPNHPNRESVLILRELRPNLQNERMVEVQSSPNQVIHIPLRELEL